MKPYVYKDRQGDWMFRCILHQESLVTYSWLSAMEAALGHLCMHQHSIIKKEHCYA